MALHGVYRAVMGWPTPSETLGKCGKVKNVEHLFAQVVSVNIYLYAEQQQTPTTMSTFTNLMSFANGASAIQRELITNGKTGGIRYDHTEQSVACDMLIDFAAKVGCCDGFKADILAKAKAGQVLSDKQAWVIAYAIAPAINESNIALFAKTTKQAAGDFDDLPMEVDHNTPFEVVKRFMEARRLGLR